MIRWRFVIAFFRGNITGAGHDRLFPLRGDSCGSDGEDADATCRCRDFGSPSVWGIHSVSSQRAIPGVRIRKSGLWRSGLRRGAECPFCVCCGGSILVGGSKASMGPCRADAVAMARPYLSVIFVASVDLCRLGAGCLRASEADARRGGLDECRRVMRARSACNRAAIRNDGSRTCGSGSPTLVYCRARALGVLADAAPHCIVSVEKKGTVGGQLTK